MPDLFSGQTGGVALILVVWVLVILVAIVGEFSYSMRTELNITRNFKEEEESYQLALAGIERAKIEILLAKEPSYIYLNEDGILVFGEGDENPVREVKLGGGIFSYTITDEDGKLNINNASYPQLRYIIENSGVDITEVDPIVDSIIDWRDTNDLHMLSGAEEDYYQSLERPYSCKDGPFDIIDELLLVKSVTPEIFYGIAPYLTSWSQGKINVNRKINVNTASREVLEAIFGITAAENIITQREGGPILTPVAGGAISSIFFTIISTGTTIDGSIKRSIKTTLRKKGEKLEVIYWNDNFIG